MHASRAAASTTMPRAGRSGVVRKIVHGLHHARHIIVVTSGCERSSTSADAAMSGAATATANGNGNGSAKQQAVRTDPAAKCSQADSLDQLSESVDRSPRQGSWCASCVACCSTRSATPLSQSCGCCGWSGYCDMHCCTGSIPSRQGPV